MKRILVALCALLCASAFGTTFTPIQLLNPAGSTSGQAIVSTGPSTVAAWAGVNAVTLNGTTFAAPGAIGSTTAAAGSFTTLAASGNDALLYANASAQSFTSGSLATVTGWTKTFDRVNTNFNAATGVFTAPVTGFYQVSSQVQFASHVNAVNAPYSLNIVVNGVAVANGVTFGQSTSTDGQSVTVSAIVNVTAGQTIVVQAGQTSGVTVALSTGGGSSVNYLSINRIP